MTILISNFPVQSFKINYNSNAQDLTPIFGGTVQRIRRGGDRFSLEIESTSLLMSDGERFNTKIKQGLSEKVQFHIPKGNLNYNYAGISAKAQTGSGRSLTLKDVPQGTLFKDGQFITVKYNRSGTIYSYLHQITADATASGANTVQLNIIPALRRTSNLANSQVEIADPFIEGLIAGQVQTTTSSTYRLKTVKISFTIEEVE